MEIRQVKISEIDRVMEIINDAIKLLGKDSLQWQQGYPNINTMSNDVNNGYTYGAYKNDVLCGVVSLVKGIDDSYTEIFDGNWEIETCESDLVVHRIAVKEEFHHKKIGKILMEFSKTYAKENGCKSIKIDTHRKNEIMQKLCLDTGFVYRGIIYLHRNEVDNSRLAYEFIV